MNMLLRAFAKKLFGVKYEKLIQAIIVNLILYGGLHSSGFRVEIAPVIFYLMISSLTAGVMWQALSSQDNAVYMQNLFMLPFENHEFVYSYVFVLGIYTFVTKTGTLLAVLLAVSAQKPGAITTGIVCAVNAILLTGAVCSLKKYWYAGILWLTSLAAAILFLGNRPWFLVFLLVNGIFSALILQSADGYSFYLQEKESHCTVTGRYRDSVCVYLMRYLNCHKNYIINTAVMWCAACVLPLFFIQTRTGILFAAPVGFAILSLNTPICILLSCDPALEQAVRFLPGQKKKFCIPYCLFIFFSNMIADTIFLCSIQIQNGGVTAWMIAAAGFFSMQSAVCSILLEWFYPIRGWKIESDLWHHPRKYIVPVVMLLLAGAVGALPAVLPVLMLLLGIEVALLLVGCFWY